jgi:thiosulfate dehydrogenase
MFRNAMRVVLVLLSATLALDASAQGTKEAWPEPNIDALPAGIAKDTIVYGRKLFNETYSVIGPEVADKAMRYSGNNLSCQSCHLRSGTQRLPFP